MTYPEALEEVKKIPFSEPWTIREKILNTMDRELTDKVCAKWMTLLLDHITYKPEPVPPADYLTMCANLSTGNAIYKVYAQKKEVVEFMHYKRKVNLDNRTNYENLKWMHEALDESEVSVKEKVRNRINEFISKRMCEREAPFGAYDFLRREESERYGIRPQASVRVSVRDISGGDSEGG
jgi:hypothetical protein